MSGRKCSTIHFDSEREQRQKALNRIDNHSRDIEGIHRQIVDALRETTRGVKEFFVAEAKTAEHWVASVEHLKSSPPLSLSSNLSALSGRVREFEVVKREGFSLQNRLLEAFISKAGQLRAEGAKQIFDAESLLSRGEELIGLWFGLEEVEHLRALTSQLRQELEADRLEQVAQLSDSLNAELTVKLRDAEANESKYQRRLYVLKALRQVSAEMAFREVGPPFSEPPGDRKSRIVFTVDTFNRGEVTFYLSLESIEVNSCISETHCFEEFAQLSNQLAETFGVITKFKMADGEATPRLIRKGELEEPTGAERSDRKVL